ncbi:transcriptional xre family [Leptolyngbya sp. Heron Island J]|uniref:helix-turn-helix domain-containing protein n=1 Tax=Leptolyngbya sp. Heron Island J TaxID=1385935 RepID=UPI0003B9911C|nr:helix-turn-helix transcriptional regulator [Leptolyngbya sp. Heron Island J]ESA39132.1 transcriptional xre family [Leptolyngbya sp. Heron Island J]
MSLFVVPVINTIKEFVDAQGITPYQFRKDVGIAQRTAYDLYNNPLQLPSSSVLTKICDRYEIQPSLLLKWVPIVEREAMASGGD